MNTVDQQPRKKKQVTDVTSLINFVRHAVCHINEDNRVHGGIERNNNEKVRKGAGIFFNRQFSKGGLFQSMQPEFDDDQSFAFGEHLIYLNRHIVRAYEEAKSGLVNKYPMIYPAEAILKNSPFPKLHETPKVEVKHTITVLVDGGPYQDAIDKIDGERFGK